MNNHLDSGLTTQGPGGEMRLPGGSLEAQPTSKARRARDAASRLAANSSEQLLWRCDRTQRANGDDEAPGKYLG